MSMSVTTVPTGNPVHPPDFESMDEIAKRINETFDVLESVGRGVINGEIKAAIVSGAAGVGKTYTLEKVLDEAKNAGEIEYTSIKGSMSAIGLYRTLFECSDLGKVLVLDDCDTIFWDLDALNLLKASLDTSKNRRVHWNKESRVLADEGIPRDFEFNGAVIFITNTDFDFEIARETKLAPHFKALMSRCLYVDMGIHTKREVFVRIGQVVLGQEFLRENKLTRAQAQDMVRWLTPNVNRVRVLSIRTVLHLASLVKSDPSNWQRMANSLMLRKNPAVPQQG